MEHENLPSRTRSLVALCALLALLVTIVWTANAAQPKAAKVAGQRSYPRSCQSLCGAMTPCSSKCNQPDGTMAKCGTWGVCYAPPLNP